MNIKFEDDMWIKYIIIVAKYKFGTLQMYGLFA